MISKYSEGNVFQMICPIEYNLNALEKHRFNNQINASKQIYCKTLADQWLKCYCVNNDHCNAIYHTAIGNRYIDAISYNLHSDFKFKTL